MLYEFPLVKCGHIKLEFCSVHSALRRLKAMQVFLLVGGGALGKLSSEVGSSGGGSVGHSWRGLALATCWAHIHACLES